MTGHTPHDLGPEERDIDRVLSAVPPVAPPIGFRDGVLRRIRPERRSTYEWPIALALAVPSLVYLIWSILSDGGEFVLALENVFEVAAGSSEQAFFAVDGTLVLAFALFAIGALVSAHALLASEDGPRT